MKKVVCLFASVALAACASHPKPMPMAMATLNSTSGSTAKGMVHFTQMKDGSVEVQVDLTGVPAGVHGFHVHEMADCGDNGNAAGGHFNPASMQHGSPEATSHHAGDFGNVTAGDNGEVHTKFMTRSINVASGMNPVAGHAVILHANADDLTSQPSGNAGPRIACGVVENMMMDDMSGMHH